MITIILKIINCIFRFCFVQPEYFYTFIIIILLCFFPYIFTCFWISCIVMKCISLEIHGYRISGIYADQKTFTLHFIEVLASVIYCRPDGNHQFNSHIFQFFDHCIRIRPVCRVKFPFALHWPVKEVNNYYRNREVTAFIFSCYFKKFFLCLITKFALPESHCIFRHHRNFACCICISFFDFGRCVTCCDPIIQFLGRKCFPCCNIFAKIYTSYSRIIPQESISKTRKHERNTCL